MDETPSEQVQSYPQISHENNLLQNFFAQLKWFSLLQIVLTSLLFITYHNQLLALPGSAWAGVIITTNILFFIISIKSEHIHSANFDGVSWHLSAMAIALISGTAWGAGLAEAILNLTDSTIMIMVSAIAIAAGTLQLYANKKAALLYLFTAFSVVIATLLISQAALDIAELMTIFSVTLALTFALNQHSHFQSDSLESTEKIPQLKHGLNETQEQIEKLNIRIISAEEDKRSAENALTDAKRNASSAGMAKDEFLATMSHEIRTPLNGILPILEILSSTDLDVDQRDYLDTAVDSSKHLLSIIDDILDYSKIEAGKLELESVGINLRELVSSVTEMMSGSAGTKNLMLRSNIDSNVRLTARGDPVRLRQVLTNLVSNAIKFTEDGQVQIKVSLHKSTKTHNEILFAIKDTGIGMSKETASRLFSAFSQADASTTRIHGGTGLGLVICKRLVDLMGGKIGVKSQVGKGSIFWFAVPLLKAVGDIEPVRKGLDGARTLILGPPGQLFQRYNTFMTSWGLHTQRVDTSIEALDTLRQSARMGQRWSYDLLLIDSESVSQGIMTLIRNIRSEHSTHDIRIVIIAEQNSSATQLKRPDIQGIIHSPIAEHQLHSTLSAALDLIDHQEHSKTQSKEAKPTKEAETTSVPDGPLIGHALLVEDNPVNLRVAEKIVTSMGMTLATANNGQIAVDKLASGQFDLILMDCQMPILDGYQATKQIRAIEQTNGSHIPIIAMTANAMAGDREKCIASGMDDYLSKPLNRKLLKETLYKWLNKKTGLKANVDKNIPSKDHQQSAEKIKENISHSVIDKSIVEDLVEIMGDEFTELIQLYLQDTPVNLNKMKKAALTLDLEQLIAPAHSLKSTSANVGAISLSEISKEIELSSRLGTIQDPQEMVATAEKIFIQVARELKSIIS